jgi:F-type H+-transporting ATPase subunit epsilon
MTSTIQCDIVSAKESIFSGKVAMFIASGISGELGITPRHAPLMTTLKPGPMRVLMPDGEEIIFVAGGGILEVMPHLVTVLADTVVRADHLDEAAAIRAKEEAERLLQTRTNTMQFAEAQAKLMEALEQLQAVERLRKMSRYKHKAGKP